MVQLRDLISQIAIGRIRVWKRSATPTQLHGRRTRVFSILGSAVLFVFLVAAGMVITAAGSRRERLIVELRDSEAKTAEVRDLMRTTLSSIGDAVIATDLRGNVSFTILSPMRSPATHAIRPPAGRSAKCSVSLMNTPASPWKARLPKCFVKETVVGLPIIRS